MLNAGLICLINLNFKNSELAITVETEIKIRLIKIIFFLNSKFSKKNNNKIRDKKALILLDLSPVSRIANKNNKEIKAIKYFFSRVLN